MHPSSTIFFKLGQLVYRHRVLITTLWVALMISMLPLLPQLMTPFQSTGFVDEHSNSAKMNDYLNQQLGDRSNRFLILYHSKTLRTDNPLYHQKINESLRALKRYPIQHDILLPNNNPHQMSLDHHTAYAVLLFDRQSPLTSAELHQLKQQITTPKHMSVVLGGESMFVDDINRQTQADLYHADIVAAPVALLILVLIFGSLVAAITPIVLGSGCAIMILSALFGIAQATTLSIFTINIALLLGLCLSLDYSLFMISRFREELYRSPTSIEHAIATTIATAGKAIFFSGLAVFISLSALLIFPVNILFSVGIGGLTAVFMAVLVALFILPALLGLLNTRIDAGLVFKKNKPSHHSTWRRLASQIIKRPLLFFFTAIIGLTVLGAPFFKVHLGVSDEHILPAHTQSRVFFDAYKQAFHQHELSPITLVVQSHTGSILSPKHIGALYDFVQAIQRDPTIPTAAIQHINSIVSINSALTKQQYQRLYQSNTYLQSPAVHLLLKTTTRSHFTIVQVVSRFNANAPETKTLISALRHLKPGHGLSVQLTGVPVSNLDVLQSITHLFPYALAWIVALTYLILLILLRSVFLPLKAILMNAFSLCATYGVLVFVFQEGHLHQWLHFEPQGVLDMSLLVIIFCALFGFSMDYEVFLLTRIHEAYNAHKNNAQSIVFGIEHSSRIITSAALLVIVTCGSFMVADVLMVKEFGLGIAVAIFVDAFLIRTFFVPATMALLEHWNWYLPAWLNKRLPNL